MTHFSPEPATCAGCDQHRRLNSERLCADCAHTARTDALADQLRAAGQSVPPRPNVTYGAHGTCLCGAWASLDGTGTCANCNDAAYLDQLTALAGDLRPFTGHFTRDELSVIRDALELYMRLQMGQAWAVAEHADRADPSPAGRERLLSLLRQVQTEITGHPSTGVARHPTVRARTRGELAGLLHDHLRYALNPAHHPAPLDSRRIIT